MKPHSTITTSPTVGRRREARLRVRLAARLILRDGTTRAVLADLSHNGAHLAGQGPGVSAGHEAVLQWGQHEAFGVVAWTAAGECGISFYDPIEQAVLLDTRELDAQARLPAECDIVREAARAFVSGTRRV